MRLFALTAAVLLTALLSAPAVAQSSGCDTRLTAGDSFRDVERIFECQQRLIARLQARIEALESAPRTEETGAPQSSEQRVWNGVGFQLLGCQGSDLGSYTYACTFLLSTSEQREFELSADLFRAREASGSLVSGGRVQSRVGYNRQSALRYSLSPEMTATIVVNFGSGPIPQSRMLESITVGGRLRWRDVPIAE